MQYLAIKQEEQNGKIVYVINAIPLKNKNKSVVQKIPHPLGSDFLVFEDLEEAKLYNDITTCVISLKDNTIIKCPLLWKQHEGTNNKYQKTEVINNHDLKITVNAQNLVDLKRKQSEECLNKFLEINNNGCKYCPYVNKCSELLDNCNITLCGYIENILK